MRKLNNIDLPAQCRWVDRLEWAGWTADGEYTLGGRWSTWQRDVVHSGRPVTIEFRADECWLSWDQVQGFIALARAGAQMLFEWDDELHNLQFDYSQKKPFSFDPIEGYGRTEANRYSGTCYFIII